MIETPAHSYERFSKQSFCIAVDQKLLAHASHVPSMADLGTGTATAVEHLYALGRLDDASLVIGIDPDENALGVARSKLSCNARATFVLGQAERVAVRDASVALVTICNSIHLMDPVATLREAFRILQPQGMLLANTAYERTRAFPEGTARAWGGIVSFARRHPILQRYEDVPHPTQVAHYSGDEYRAIAEAVGFEHVSVEYHTVTMDRAAVKAICNYEGFASGVLPGVPIELATCALVDAVDPAFARSRIDSIRRTWMFLIACKGGGDDSLDARLPRA
jgi:ubiquinone/menaquinone biosynthesis C-methylase UbiE